MDEKLRKLVSRNCPVSERLFFGRRYLLPQYRQNDYGNLQLVNGSECERLLKYALGEFDDTTERNFLALANVLVGLHYHRPVLYLERELGEVLVRTPLPDLSGITLRWRWGGYSIILPRLLSIGEEGNWFTYYRICRSDEPIRCPVAQEIDLLAAKLAGGDNLHRLEKLECRFQQPGYILSAGLDEAGLDADRPRTVYSRFRAWEEIASVAHPPIRSPDAEREALDQVERLAANIALFLSAAPSEYEMGELLRRGRREGNHLISELQRATFVGELARRPRARSGTELSVSDAKDLDRHEAIRHMAPHWASGCWRRVAHGPRHSLRRLTWIGPYQTYDHGTTPS